MKGTSDDEELSKARWREAEWREFELWEKIEARLAKRKRLGVIAASILFLILLSIPVYREQVPRWSALRVARQFADEITELKRDAVIRRKPMLLRVEMEEKRLRLDFFETERCGLTAPAADQTPRSVHYLKRRRARVDVSLLSPNDASRLGIPQGANSFCYDPAVAFSQTLSFIFIPQSDIAEVENASLDRAVILIAEGPEATLTYE